MKFRKKPIVIEARQLAGDQSNRLELVDWIKASSHAYECHASAERVLGIMVSTLEGSMLAEPGDWIIKGVKGEFYPCKPDIFKATYTAAGWERHEPETVHENWCSKPHPSGTDCRLPEVTSTRAPGCEDPECACNEPKQPDDGTTLHDKRCSKAEPRRNPYEDCYVAVSSDTEHALYTKVGVPLVCGSKVRCKQVGVLLIQAWNKGAQIAGERDV